MPNREGLIEQYIDARSGLAAIERAMQDEPEVDRRAAREHAVQQLRSVRVRMRGSEIGAADASNDLPAPGSAITLALVGTGSGLRCNAPAGTLIERGVIERLLAGVTEWASSHSRNAAGSGSISNGSLSSLSHSSLLPCPRRSRSPRDPGSARSTRSRSSRCC